MTDETSPAPHANQPEDTPALRQLYADFKDNHLNPLWTQTANLMPPHPRPEAVAHVWEWGALYDMAVRSGDLVPVGRGGERRAIGLANPGLGGRAYISPTLWAAVQYLGPGENAPEHRHAQNAFRFVIEGEGVWTVVDGDPVRMSRGDLLLTAGWKFHGHQNIASDPMVWLDGLDIPFGQQMDVGFFEFGPEVVSDLSTPDLSRAERLWGHPSIRPLSRLEEEPSSPLPAYRWVHTDAALREQLALEDEGHNVTLSKGHAAIRFINPTTGKDVLPTMRCQFHRLRQGAVSVAKRDVGSSVFQVFEGSGHVTLGNARYSIKKGDIFVVPSWIEWSLEATTEFDLFHFSDAPIMEKLNFARSV